LPRVKIEFTSDCGERVTVVLSGRFSKHRVAQLLDLFDLMFRGEVEEVKGVSLGESVFERVVKLVKSRFGDGWFTSADLVAAYKEVYGEDLRPGTASTYLARLCESGLLEKKGSRSCWSYRLVASSSKRVKSSFLDNVDSLG